LYRIKPVWFRILVQAPGEIAFSFSNIMYFNELNTSSDFFLGQIEFSATDLDVEDKAS